MIGLRNLPAYQTSLNGPDNATSFYFLTLRFVESMQCPCYCIKEVAATKEACKFRSDPVFDVYTFKGTKKVSTTKAAPTKAPGNTFVIKS